MSGVRPHMQIYMALRQRRWSRRTRDLSCCGFFVANIIQQNWNQRTDASDHICVSQWPVINDGH